MYNNTTLIQLQQLLLLSLQDEHAVRPLLTGCLSSKMWQYVPICSAE